MNAEFLAVGSFHLKSRKLFVIVGDIVSGEVRSGMTLSLPLNATLAVTGKVASVEFVDVTHEGRSHIGLCLAYDSPEELEFWQAMSISGETFSLS